MNLQKIEASPPQSGRHPFLNQTPMEYVLILERDESVGEAYLNYCQWTHNEDEMLKLIRYIKSVKDEHADTLGENSSRFYVAEALIPEAVVDMHKALVFSNEVTSPFYKYEGIFKCPSFLKKDKVLKDDEDDEDDKNTEDGYHTDDSEEEDQESPKRKNSWDMDLDEEPEEVDAFECAHRLSYYFHADGFMSYFIKDE